MWIVDGSTADSLEFGVGEKIGHEKSLQFGYLIVEHCALDSAGLRPRDWAIVDSLNGTAEPYPTRIRYGALPSGFEQRVPAEPLGQGCYVAMVMGTGHTRFLIDSAGLVSADPP